MSSRSMDVFIAIMTRTWKKTFRRPVALTFSLFQPLVWMLFFGFLMQRFPLGSLPKNVSYISYLAPGLCAMTVLFGASQSGIGLIRDLQTGILHRILASPAPHWAVHTARVFADALRLLLQAMIVALLGLALGADMHFTVSYVVTGFSALFLFAVALASLSHIVAMRTRRQESMATFVHTINMPLFFTSTALVPRSQMPDWLAGIADWNPLSLTVECLRDALIFDTSPDGRHVVMLLVLATSLTLVAVWQQGSMLSASTWEAR